MSHGGGVRAENYDFGLDHGQVFSQPRCIALHREGPVSGRGTMPVENGRQTSLRLARQTATGKTDAACVRGDWRSVSEGSSPNIAL